MMCRKGLEGMSPILYYDPLKRRVGGGGVGEGCGVGRGVGCGGVGCVWGGWL